MPLPDPTKPLKVVLLSDPNLSDEMDVVAYQKTRDESLIKDKSDACKAVRFELQPITYRCLTAIDRFHASMPGRWTEAFLSSCRAIYFSDGTVWQPKGLQTIRPEGRKVSWTVAGDEWEERVVARWGINALYELGRIAYDRARLPTEGGDADPLG